MKEEKDFSKEFKRIKRYKIIGILWIVVGGLVTIDSLEIIMDGARKNEMIKLAYLLPAIIGIIVGNIYLWRIKCPGCGHLFRYKQWLMEVKWCPSCGAKLGES